MKLSCPQDAPAVPVSASVTVIDGPPLIDAILSFLSSRNPTRLPSGEKNGEVTPSVPGTAVACSWLVGRIRSCDRGPPMYASRDPSGESSMRADHDAPLIIASVESTTSV